MTTAERLDELKQRLLGKDLGEAEIIDARPTLIENFTGEQVTRVWLRLTPPEVGETWSLDLVRDMRAAAAHAAEGLELPTVFVPFGADDEEDLPAGEAMEQ